MMTEAGGKRTLPGISRRHRRVDMRCEHFDGEGSVERRCVGEVETELTRGASDHLNRRLLRVRPGVAVG